MNSAKINCILFVVVAAILPGCHEGPFWQSSAMYPWVQKRWAEDEQIAETMYAKRSRLRELAKSASRMDPSEQQRVAGELLQILGNERSAVIRLEATRALGKIPGSVADRALAAALEDPEADIRVAAVQSLGKRPATVAVPLLRNTIGSDLDKQVRAAALRQLGTFEGEGVLESLALGLNEEDPALRYLAMQSLENVTDADLGPNITAWREYLNLGSPTSPALDQNTELIAEGNSDLIIR